VAPASDDETLIAVRAMRRRLCARPQLQSPQVERVHVSRELRIACW
jgi:hypothetical protein